MNLMKRVISVVLACVLAVTLLVPIQVSAYDSNQRASAMVTYFKDNATESIENFTEEDIRLFGLYISNFYTPLVTTEQNIAPAIKDAISKIKGGSSLTDTDNKLVESLASIIINNIIEKSEPLKTESGEPVTLADFIYGKEASAYTLQYNGKAIFGNAKVVIDTTDEEDESGEDGSVSYGDTGQTLETFTEKDLNPLSNFLKAIIIDEADKKIGQDWLKVVFETHVQTELYLTPFGDIVAKKQGENSFLVVLPACLNWYSYSSSSVKIPLMSSFLLSKCLIHDSVNNGAEVEITKDNNKLTDSNGLAITKLARVYSDTYSQDCYCITWGSYFGANSHLSYLKTNDVITNVASTYSGLSVGNRSAFARRILGLFKTTWLDANYVYDEMTLFSSEDEPIPCALYGTNKKSGFYNCDNDIIYEYVRTGVRKNVIAPFSSSEVPFKAYPYRFADESTEGTSGLASIISFIRTANVGGDNGVLPYAEIYYTYMFMRDTSKGSTVSWLPAMTMETSAASNMLSQNDEDDGVDKDLGLKLKANEMLDSLKALINPSYNEAKGTFLDSMIGAWVLKQHRKMLGITNMSATVSSDSQAYSGFTGHVTTPRLRDVELTANFLEHYRDIYFTLLAILLLFTIFMIMLHMRTVVQGVATFIVMAIVLILPQSTIDLTVQLSNTVNEQLFNNRFNYWAILQHQMALSGSLETDSNAILDAAQNTATNMNSYYADTGVRLKWLSPKKYNKAELVLENSESTEDVSGSSMFKWLFKEYFNQESYANEAGATYVYRTYTSLSQDAESLYQEIKDNVSGAYNMQGTFGAYTQGNDYLNNLFAFEPQQAMDKFGNTVQVFGSSANNGGKYTKETAIKTAYHESGRITCLYQGMDSLINADVLSALEHNKNVKTGAEDGYNVRFMCTGADTSLFEPGGDLYNYGLYSESPYYYFYNTLRSIQLEDNEKGIGASESGDATFLSILLAESPYKVTEGEMYGYYKDFLDIESLFTYIVPYLQASNEFVIDWTDMYGLYYTDLIDGTLTMDEKKDLMGKVWNMYSPWVDALYSEDIWSGKIRSGGYTEGVLNAFSPYSYEGYGYRPMVFSEADMYYNGVGYNDLSEVEKKVQEVLKMTYEDFRYLANYANFSDEALASAAAMIATFNFNTVFSQNKMVGRDITLYPQGYEMKSFSYDAFLRLIMLNSTGASPLSSTDIYTQIIRNTSFLTGIVLLITDFLAVYVVPGAKFAFVICAFVLSMVMCIGIYLQKIDQAFKVVVNAIIVPMLMFFAVSFGHAFFTSMLMGEGLTEYVGSQGGAWVTGDPTISLVVLMVINAATSVILVKMLIKLVNTLIAWCRDTVDSMAGIITAIGGAITAKVSEFANTGKVRFAGATTASQDKEAQWQQKNGVGYRTMSSNVPKVSAPGSMPTALSRKLAATGKNIGGAVAQGAKTLGNSTVGKVVRTGGAMVTGAVGGFALATVGKAGYIAERAGQGIKHKFSNLGDSVKTKIDRTKLAASTKATTEKLNTLVNNSANKRKEALKKAPSFVSDYDTKLNEYNRKKAEAQKAKLAAENFTIGEYAQSIKRGNHKKAKSVDELSANDIKAFELERKRRIEQAKQMELENEQSRYGKRIVDEKTGEMIIDEKNKGFEAELNDSLRNLYDTDRKAWKRANRAAIYVRSDDNIQKQAVKARADLVTENAKRTAELDNRMYNRQTEQLQENIKLREKYGIGQGIGGTVKRSMVRSFDKVWSGNNTNQGNQDK